MTDVNQLITDHLDIWTSATEKKSSAGRGKNGRVNLYGIKKLRELILYLAVRGKLVHQVSHSGEKRAKIKETDRLRTDATIEYPFEVPINWEWVKLESIAEINGGFAFKSSKYTNEGVRVIRISDFDEVGFKDAKIVRHPFSKELDKFKLEKDNILLAMTGGTVGKSFLVEFLPETMVVNQRVATIQLLPGSNPAFVNIVVRSNLFQSKVHDAKNSTNDNISMRDIKGFDVPLPPLAEQHRIVAKVDELMGLCDALEAQAEDSLKAHQTLVETCLATLTNSQTPEDLTQNWTRLEAHFDTLFTTEKSVVCLKEVLLQLGVRGKLLPQNEDDEAASVLLQKLLRGKSHKKKRGRGAVGESTATEPPCSLPKNWIWHRFGDLVEFQSELVKPDGYQDFLQVAPDIIEKGTGRLIGQRTVGEAGIRGPNNRFYAGQILYSKIRPSLSKAVIAAYDGLCSADMYPLKSLIDPDFLLLSILSEDFLVQVRKLENRIKMPKLNVGSLSSIYVAVPPLSEQPRIVEKVKSMFGICDQIRADIEKSRQYNIQIADTLTSKIH